MPVRLDNSIREGRSQGPKSRQYGLCRRQCHAMKGVPELERISSVSLTSQGAYRLEGCELSCTLALAS